MVLSNLLKDQTVIIDGHKWGGEVHWDKALHIHKRMNRNSKSYVSCEIYFARGDGDVKFTDENGNETDKLKREISEAFLNDSIRQEFIRSFSKKIIPMLDCNGRKLADIVRVVKRGIKRISHCFGLSDELTEEMIDESRKIISYKVGKAYIGYNYEHQGVIASDSRKDMLDVADEYFKNKK